MPPASPADDAMDVVERDSQGPSKSTDDAEDIYMVKGSDTIEPGHNGDHPGSPATQPDPSAHSQQSAADLFSQSYSFEIAENPAYNPSAKWYDGMEGAVVNIMKRREEKKSSGRERSRRHRFLPSRRVTQNSSSKASFYSEIERLLSWYLVDDPTVVHHPTKSHATEPDTNEGNTAGSDTADANTTKSDTTRSDTVESYSNETDAPQINAHGTNAHTPATFPASPSRHSSAAHGIDTAKPMPNVQTLISTVEALKKNDQQQRREIKLLRRVQRQFPKKDVEVQKDSDSSEKAQDRLERSKWEADARSNDLERREKEMAAREQKMAAQMAAREKEVTAREEKVAAQQREMAARKEEMTAHGKVIEERERSIKRREQAVPEQAKALRAQQETASTPNDDSEQPSVTNTSANNTRAQRTVAESLTGRDPTTTSTARAVMNDARSPRVQHFSEVMMPSKSPPHDRGKAKPLRISTSIDSEALSQGQLALSRSKSPGTTKDDVSKEIAMILQGRGPSPHNLDEHADMLADLVFFDQDISRCSSEVRRFYGNVRSAIDGFCRNHVQPKVLAEEKWLDFDTVRSHHDIFMKFQQVRTLHVGLEVKSQGVRATLRTLAGQEASAAPDNREDRLNWCKQTTNRYVSSVREFRESFRMSKGPTDRMKVWATQEMDKWTSKIEEVAAKFDVQMRVSS